MIRTLATIDQLALLTLVNAITGLLALLSWESLFPSRRDYLLLAGFPVRPHQIFLARFLSMLLFATGLVLAINLLPAFLTPHEFTVISLKRAHLTGPVSRSSLRSTAQSACP